MRSFLSAHDEEVEILVRQIVREYDKHLAGRDRTVQGRRVSHVHRILVIIYLGQRTVKRFSKCAMKAVVGGSTWVSSMPT